MTDDITERIRLIMQEYSNSPSAFADEIGVQRPAISHIMSGRNRPSLDVVMKILKAYDQINPQWLLTGEGKMKQLDLFGGISESDDNTKKLTTDNQYIKETKPLQSPVENQPVYSPATAQSQPLSPRIEENKAESITSSNQSRQFSTEPGYSARIEEGFYESSKQTELQANRQEKIYNQDQHYTQTHIPPQNTHSPTSAPPPISKPSENIPTELFGGGGGKKVEKIVILYADKSFSVYHPE